MLAEVEEYGDKTIAGFWVWPHLFLGTFIHFSSSHPTQISGFVSFVSQEGTLHQTKVSHPHLQRQKLKPGKFMDYNFLIEKQNSTLLNQLEEQRTRESLTPSEIIFS